MHYQGKKNKCLGMVGFVTLCHYKWEKYLNWNTWADKQAAQGIFRNGKTVEDVKCKTTTKPL